MRTASDHSPLSSKRPESAWRAVHACTGRLVTCWLISAVLAWPHAGMASATGDAERLIGRDVPLGATGVRASGEHGIDQLALLRFEVPVAVAHAYARDVVGKEPVAGMDPGLGYLGEHVSWWVRTPPVGFAGAELRRADGRTVKLLTTPMGSGRLTVYVAAFDH